AQSEQSLEQRLRLAAPAGVCVGVDEPEAARQKSAFVSAQAVMRLLGPITAHQPIFQQASLDGTNRPLHTRIAGGQEAETGHEEEARVDRGAVVRLRERVETRIETVLTNIAMNAIAQGPKRR